MARRRRRFKLIPLFLIFLIAVTIVAANLFILPDVAPLRSSNPEETAFMKRREKQESNRTFTRAERGLSLKERPGRERELERIQIWKPLEEISSFLQNAVIVAEDGAFFQHNGVDLHQMREALKTDIKRRRISHGGSTITQQLAKNLYLSASKNPLRKIKEVLIARRLEKRLSKKRILEIYLNVVEWGPGVYGAEAAAKSYFNHSASELTPEQAAWLAALLPSPIRYGREQNSKYVEKMSQIILGRMKRQGYLPEDYLTGNEMQAETGLEPPES